MVETRLEVVELPSVLVCVGDEQLRVHQARRMDELAEPSGVDERLAAGFRVDRPRERPSASTSPRSFRRSSRTVGRKALHEAATRSLKYSASSLVILMS